MQEAARKQYLKAMGVDLWVRRGVALAEEGQSVQSQIVEPQVVLEPNDEVIANREVFRQNANELTSWLKTQCLMPVRVGDVSVTTIGRADAKLLVLSQCSVVDKVTHQPFSGRAAFLLQAMLRAIGESFETVLQAELDTPHSDAKTLCSVLQEKPIKAVLLLADLPLGEVAESLSLHREKIYHHDDAGPRIFVSFHPDYLLVHPETKALAWADLKLVRDYLAND